MLEHLDLSLTVSKADYDEQLPLLQANLYDLQHEIFTRQIPVVGVFAGWAAAGKGSTLNVLAERLDPRGFRVVSVLPPRTAEQQYPWMQRFWLQVPARGQMVAFDMSWYRRVTIDRLLKTVKRREWEQAYEDIRDFERMLADDGTVIIKFWLHISEKEQRRRLKKLRQGKHTAWQVTDEDRAQHKKYGKYLAMVEAMLARTDAPHAPWTLVEAHDRYFTRLKVFETIIRALEVRLAAQPAA